MAEHLTLDMLTNLVRGTAAALRCVTDYQPAGGPGDKVLPPTYENGTYAEEERYIHGERIPCVLLDSVQSQANRMELALLEAWEQKLIPLPIISVDFRDRGLLKRIRVTSLEAPHRIADAILRDSLLDGKPFRKSATGKALDDVDSKNATVLFELCPTALIFGMWDSTGPRGGSGAKFARAMVSEIIGLHATRGKKTSSRMDPLAITVNAGPLYRAADKDGIHWTLEAEKARQDKKAPMKLGKDGKPSEANHSNVTPSIVDGGYTISKAVQTTVLSLPALRRLRFPIDGELATDIDDVARTTLAALAICSATLARHKGCDLRSRCLLHAVTPFQWQVLDQPGDEAKPLEITLESAITLYKQAVGRAKEAGLPWRDEELALAPSDALVALVKRSQELAAQVVAE